ncbi:hypothetical protein AB0I81_33255 [Nonomuraea sp. NPDC050404]|uniref:hypothetical protein n=1 Tax=Nonomuraea sp. NPDC050404 TaxID=3155783 RepID=UPI0033D6A008
MRTTRILAAAAAVVTGWLLLAAPAPAATAGVVPDPTTDACRSVAPTARLVEMTTPKSEGVFYTACATEVATAERMGFKRTTTPLGQVATRPFRGGVPLYRFRVASASSYILTSDRDEYAELKDSARFIEEGVVGFIGRTGDSAKRIWRFHFDHESKWRIAIAAHADVIRRDEPGWTLDGPHGYFR